MFGGMSLLIYSDRSMVTFNVLSINHIYFKLAKILNLVRFFSLWGVSLISYFVLLLCYKCDMELTGKLFKPVDDVLDRSCLYNI